MQNLLLAAAVVVASSLTPSALAGSGKVQRARFEPWLSVLRPALLAPKHAGKAADALLADGASRVAAFELQALGKIYEQSDKDFKDLRKAFKEIEDGIGDVDKWDKILKKSKKSGAPASELAKLQARVTQARTNFVALLGSKGWVKLDGKSRLAQIEEFLAEYDWSSAEKDRGEVVEVLRDQLKNVEETKYDMSILEHGDGLHELRRELRWFLIQARVLNGAVRHSDDTCPVPALEKLLKLPIAQSKYAELPGSALEKQPCWISSCLFVALVKQVEDLGEIKDEAETLVNRGGSEASDQVPPALRARAQASYDALLESQALGKLRAELKACKK